MCIPEEAKRLNFDRKGLIYYIVVSWATLPSERSFFKAALVTVLQKVKAGDRKDFWFYLGGVIDWVRRQIPTRTNKYYTNFGTVPDL
jgi:hypothetical protein